MYGCITIINPNIILVEENLPLDGGYSVDGVKRALIEWLLLSSVKKAIISKVGFALKACDIGNVKYEFI